MCKPNKWPNESVGKMVIDRKNERRVADHAGLRKLTESDLGLLAKSLEANRSLVAAPQSDMPSVQMMPPGAAPIVPPPGVA